MGKVILGRGESIMEDGDLQATFRELQPFCLAGILDDVAEEPGGKRKGICLEVTNSTDWKSRVS